RDPVAATQEPGERDEARRPRAAARAPGGEPRAVHRLRPEGRLETAVALSLSGRRAAILARLVPARHGESDPGAPDLRDQSGGADRRRHQPLPLPAAHRAPRGHQQQDQSAQAHGLRLSGRRLLLPENPRRVSRNSVKNPKKGTYLSELSIG